MPEHSFQSQNKREREEGGGCQPLSNFKCKLKYWSRWPSSALVTVNTGSSSSEPSLRCICILSGRDPITSPYHSTPVELHGISRASLASLVPSATGISCRRETRKTKVHFTLDDH
nr:PREDICTED: uncharacterized protein LOC105663135 [Megachile rotundata]